MRFLLSIFVLSFLIPQWAWADSLGSKLTEHKHKKETLEREVEEIQRDLNGTRNDLVSVGKSVQANEKILQTLEGRIAELEKQKTDLRGTLDKDRRSIADLILALERIRRVPPEAMIAKPDAPFKTAQSAMLMGDIIPALNKKAEDLKINLKHLDDTTKELEVKHEAALKTAKTLEAEQRKLAGLVDKREKLFADTHADLQEEEANVKRISQQAQNLADLVSRLNVERQRQAQVATRGPDVRVPSGEARLPISGIIRTRYDEPDDFGAPSKGISIEGRPGALVVAPMGGIVRFAGHFRNYGNIVILEHQKGYHSLIAGLEKIDTVVGQSVSAGEALGLLHRAENPGEKPALYYELRLNGRPVNPAAKFADLG